MRLPPRFPLWLAAALAYGLAFPSPQLAPLGFLFMVPLLLDAEKRRPAAAFVPFFLFALVAHLILLYWIPRVMVRYGGTTWFLGVVGLVCLAAFLSLFTGLAGMLIVRAVGRGGCAAFFCIPAAWVAKDLVVERVLGGFPWCLAGYTQYRNIPFLQWAELGGIHLLSFLLVAANVLVYLFLKRRDKSTAAVLAAFLAVVHAGGLGLLRAHEARAAAAPRHRAGIVQPNSNHDQAFDFARVQETLDRLFRVSAGLAGRGAEFVVWPEFTVPIYPRQAPYYKEQFLAFSRGHAPLLAGFTDPRGSAGTFNSVLLFAEDGIAAYDKVHLTPFGEFVPFRRLLFFVRKITDEIGDFSPGARLHNLELAGRKLATPICYEVIFPGLVRSLVAGGGQAIVTLSNDSWFGNTSAPRQHLAMAACRSVENRRWLLRSTSNGISALVDPAGRIVRHSPMGRADEFLAEFQYLSRLTVFSRWGYRFPYACLFLALALLARAPSRRRGPPTSPEAGRGNRRTSRSAQRAPGAA